jgi:predicted DNA-binding transcriptional regulator AlpA
MSLVTQMIVAEKYGVRLGMEQLAEAIGMTKPAIYNAVSSGRFAIPTYIDGGKRWADYRDVAAHLDACREKALEQAAAA